MPCVGFECHDHSGCIAQTVAAVEARCAEENLQFTPVRRRVLEILLQQHRAMGAYEILDVLRAEGLSAQPPVAYRALEFLTRHGFAHKIENRNAFTACSRPDSDHAPVFLICRVCNSVAEIASHQARSPVAKAAQQMGFTIDRLMIEAEGLCPRCQDEAAQA